MNVFYDFFFKTFAGGLKVHIPTSRDVIVYIIILKPYTFYSQVRILIHTHTHSSTRTRGNKSELRHIFITTLEQKHQQQHQAFIEQTSTNTSKSLHYRYLLLHVYTGGLLVFWLSTKISLLKIIKKMYGGQSSLIKHI